MRIEKISSHGTVAVKEVEIKVTTPITLICGSNRAGKTSLRDGIFQAFTGENPKVQLKKNYKHLINDADGNSVGYTYVEFDDGKKAAITLPNGTHELTAQLHSALPYVLDPSLFATSKPDERRSFLFNLGNLRSDGAEVKGKLLERNCDAAKVEIVMPFLKSSFDTAKQHADKKTTEARANWKAIAGENYGSLKAADWKAQKPEVDPVAAASAKTLLDAFDQELEEENQRLGSMQTEFNNSAKKEAEINGLRTTSAQIERIENKLSVDRKELAMWTVKVEDARYKAKGSSPSKIATKCPECAAELTWNGKELAKREGDLHGDEDAAVKLPELERTLTMLKNAVSNGERDLAAAKYAKDKLVELEKESKEVISEERINQLKEKINSLRTRRKQAQESLDLHNKNIRSAAEADEKTKKAAGYHADVQAWDLISSSLAPDGIPSEMLSAALDPINARIAASIKTLRGVNPALPANVLISEDMTIFEDGNLYALSSKATKLLIDSVIAEAISHVSGIKFFMVDEFDLLDLPSRSAYLGWLIDLAENNEVDSFVLFGTLKEKPAKLPPEVAAHWIQDGLLKNDKAIEEAA